MKRPKAKWQVWQIDVAVTCTAVVLIGAGLWFSISRTKTTNLTCRTVGAEHTISIKEDAFSSDHLTLKRCDTIQIVNDGSADYLFAFGTHEQHIEYPGFSEQELGPNEYFIIDAIQPGKYLFHDHLKNKAQIVFDIQ